MTRQEIIKLVQKATGEKPEKIKVERPEEASHGDYSTNIALQIKRNPDEIVKKLKSDLFKKVEVVKPGFINFFLSKGYLQKQVEEILKQGEKFGQLNVGKGQKVNVEFISANPTGQLHIGNGRGAFFGDTLANILEMADYRVSREYYINDVKNSNQIQELGKTALGKGKSYLTPYLKSLIFELKPSLAKFKSESEAGYFLARNILGDIRKFVQEKLKINFDFWVSEQNLYRQEKVREIYEFLKNKKLVYEKDGAFWLKLEKFGQKEEVLIRKNGQPTYFLSDIAYHQDKIKRGFRKIINIWGADHQGHVSRTRAAMKILGYKGEFDILISQVVRLKKRKISKRAGEIVALEDLINEVGLDAVRFLYLTKSLDTQMEFDLELAKGQSEKNPVYYVQYAHARICSILRKTRPNQRPELVKSKLLNHPSELELIKQLIRFPEIIEDTTKDYQVQRLPQYATDLATVFHQFYRDCQVLTETRSLSEARLGLILATKTVLKNTLNLMGISAPDKM